MWPYGPNLDGPPHGRLSEEHGPTSGRNNGATTGGNAHGRFNISRCGVFRVHQCPWARGIVFSDTSVRDRAGKRLVLCSCEVSIVPESIVCQLGFPELKSSPVDEDSIPQKGLQNDYVHASPTTELPLSGGLFAHQSPWFVSTKPVFWAAGRSWSAQWRSRSQAARTRETHSVCQCH